MRGRDPHEHHRSSSPLETLFDLTIAIAISRVAEQLAHLLSAGQVSTGLIGFGFAMFSVCWAWVNFSWFASAFDTDDWLFRLVTMQMTGVLVLALGLPRMFHSLAEGGHLDNSIMVLGSVVMRLAMVFQWLRVARQSPKHRRAALIYMTTIVVAQVGWVLLVAAHLSISAFFALGAVLTLVELGGPGVRLGVPRGRHDDVPARAHAGPDGDRGRQRTDRAARRGRRRRGDGVAAARRGSGPLFPSAPCAMVAFPYQSAADPKRTSFAA